MDLVLFTSSRAPGECAGIEEAVKAVAKKFRGSLHVSILDMEEKANKDAAAQFQIFSAPGLVFNGERAFPGGCPSEAELEKFIEGKISEKKSASGKGREKSRYWSISGLPEQWNSEY